MIALKPYDIKHLDPLVRHANNPRVAQYLRERFPSPFLESNGRWWIEEGCRQGGNLNFAIEANGEFVGGIGTSFFQDERRHSAEVGYWIGEAFWGKGLATAAVREIIDVVFAREDISRLFSPVAAPNVGSMRVLEKCGFEREGVLKQAMMLRGRVYDEHVFGLLKD